MAPPKRITPGPGQESVWDYPRPAILEPTSKRIEVVFGGETIADTTAAYRALETSHPPTYYLPPQDVRMELLTQTARKSLCEWKGAARYFTVRAGGREAADAAWTYTSPTGDFAAIAGYLAFYPQLMDVCRVNGEIAAPQPGGFYGGWVTSDLAGPFKGAPGTMGW